jgi:uncharacterized protein YjiS (DUF1127 family)
MHRLAHLLLIRPFAQLAAQVRHRRAACQLGAFDDRTLADIGMTRSGIDFAVRHGRHRVASAPRVNTRPFTMTLVWQLSLVLLAIAVLSMGVS